MVNSFFGIGQTNTKPNSGFGALPNFNVTIDNFYEHLEKYYTSEEEHLDIEQESLSPKGHAIECHRGLFQRAMYDGRNNLCRSVEADVREHYGARVYKTVIPRNVRVSEAPSFGLPAIVYDMKCSGALAYIHLAAELLRKEGQLPNNEAAA